MGGLKAAGHRIGLATDTGGGSSFSMLRTMAAAYEVGQLRGTPLHAAQLYWLATVGSAQAMRMDGQIGNLSKGIRGRSYCDRSGINACHGTKISPCRQLLGGAVPDDHDGRRPRHHGSLGQWQTAALATGSRQNQHPVVAGRMRQTKLGDTGIEDVAPVPRATASSRRSRRPRWTALAQYSRQQCKTRNPAP